MKNKNHRKPNAARPQKKPSRLMNSRLKKWLLTAFISITITVPPNFIPIPGWGKSHNKTVNSNDVLIASPIAGSAPIASPIA